MGTPNKKGGLGKFFKAAIEVKAITAKSSSRYAFNYSSYHLVDISMHISLLTLTKWNFCQSFTYMCNI